MAACCLSIVLTCSARRSEYSVDFARASWSDSIIVLMLIAKAPAGWVSGYLTSRRRVRSPLETAFNMERNSSTEASTSDSMMAESFTVPLESWFTAFPRYRGPDLRDDARHLWLAAHRARPHSRSRHRTRASARRALQALLPR